MKVNIAFHFDKSICYFYRLKELEIDIKYIFIIFGWGRHCKKSPKANNRLGNKNHNMNTKQRLTLN